MSRSAGDLQRRLRRHFAAVALGGVAAGDVAGFVAEHGGDVIVDVADFIKAAIEAHLVARQHERVLLRAVEQPNSQR